MCLFVFWFKDCVNGYEKKGKVILEMICNKVIVNGFVLFCWLFRREIFYFKWVKLLVLKFFILLIIC